MTPRIAVGFGVCMVLAPIWQLVKAASGRADSSDVEWALLPTGLALLGFVALAVWAVVTQWERAWADYVRPYQEVGSWFS